MQHLQGIQIYLRDRCKNCRFADKTIFSVPDEGCFAMHYLKQSAEHNKLRERIEIASISSRGRKEFEWNNACKKYDDLGQKISDSIWVCSFDPDGSRNCKGCKNCWHWRSRQRLILTAHEDFLPENLVWKAVFSSALEEVEQEREFESQVEEVREVQVPMHHEALVFPGLHTAILIFAQTGDLGESGYEHVFQALSRFTIDRKYKACRTGSRLSVSSEFMRTIKIRKTRKQAVEDDDQNLHSNFMVGSCPIVSGAFLATTIN